MDIRKVKKLIELVESSDVAEIKIADDEGSIRITRARTQIDTSSAVAVSDPRSAVNQPASSEADSEEMVVEEKEGKIIYSPMVGTFYSSSSPEKEPFVKVGSKVTAGQTLCIIEAMKVMNQIIAEHSGEIIEIMMDDAQPVEYDQPLFRIK